MCIGKSDSLCDLIVFHGRIFQKFLCLLHSGADQNLCKSFSRHFFEYGAEITGADIKIRTDIIQTQVRIHIIFLNIYVDDFLPGAHRWMYSVLSGHHKPVKYILLRFCMPVQKISAPLPDRADLFFRRGFWRYRKKLPLLPHPRHGSPAEDTCRRGSSLQMNCFTCSSMD